MIASRTCWLVSPDVGPRGRIPTCPAHLLPRCLLLGGEEEEEEEEEEWGRRRRRRRRGGAGDSGRHEGGTVDGSLLHLSPARHRSVCGSMTPRSVCFVSPPLQLVVVVVVVVVVVDPALIFMTFVVDWARR